MAVISVCIIENPDQIISGIPINVSITTNITATIFYTMDGTTPTLFSAIYTGPITFPTNVTSVVLSVFATNGVDNSPVLVQCYETDILGKNARFPHSGTNAAVNSTQATIDPGPFGSPPISSNQQFLGPGAAGLNVYNPLLPAGPPTGYDSNGNPAGFTNGQDIGIPTKRFPLLYSESDAEGKEGYGIGTLPPDTVIRPAPPPERSNINDINFDPRALVIIQDLTQPVDPGLPPHINRQFFTLEDVTHTREGNQMFNVGPDAPPVSGSLVRRSFNPQNNTLTHYFFDSTQNRWIISTVPYTPTNNLYSYSSNIVPGRGQGGKFVYQWIPFKANYLY